MRKPGKTRVINFRLTEAQYARLQYAAANAGVSLCSYARQAVLLVVGGEGAEETGVPVEMEAPESAEAATHASD